ncbi:beta-ketoacyl-ACP synthase III [Truepera radiovictrix]|uniref:beta-ketoacyl-ACP synthase III n=1 Tax=Truepera radiovictrix TaxID=332249 RepID=UPI0005A54A8A
MRAGISALGAYAPEKHLTNFDLEKMMDTSDAWITTRTGIRTRHVAADGEFTSHLAVRSVEALVARHGEGALEGVDMVIVATNTPDALFPATAALVQHHFGLRAGAFDLLAACPGWLYALSVARAYVESGMMRKVLAIGAEALTKIVDWSDRATAVLFGDGAGAAIVEATPAPYGFRSFVLGTDGAGGHLLHRRAVARCLPDGTPMTDYLYMNGREVFKFAVRVMDTATVEALGKAGLNANDVALFVPHQANLRIIEAARERLQLPPERVMVTVDAYGNNSTASIPLALQSALDTGRLRAGDHTLLVSFGAGLTWAATVLTWGGGGDG